MSYPQPREGVAGTLRDGDYLLSLDEQALPVRDAIVALASHLYNATLVGNPVPVVRRMYERLREPQPGDLVIEQSTMYYQRDDRAKAFGILLLHRDEWWTTDEEWEEYQDRERRTIAERWPDDPFEPDLERMVDHAWYVQYGQQPVDVCRWTNCRFMVIPTVLRQFDVPFGTRDAAGKVTVTRTDLLSFLADTGF